MNWQHSSLGPWFALLLSLAACGEDAPPKGGSPTDDDDDAVSEPGDDDDDDDDDSDTGSRRDGGAGASDGGRANSGRDASNTQPNRDAGGTQPSPGKDAGGGDGQPDAGKEPPPGPTACDATKAPSIPPLALEPVVTGLSKLTYAAQPPGSSDWYLLEQGGKVRVFKDGALLPDAFLDFGNEITALMAGFGANEVGADERGLLGIAFAPDYESSGSFYVMLTPTAGSAAGRDSVREYKRSAADPYKADPMWTKQLVQLPSSAFNHNGGHLTVGPDGMLYVGTGDGGGSCNSDKPGASQDSGSLFGKILRLDPKAAGPEYGAAGNPFASAPAVLHIGLRNPYRFAFDRETGDLYIGDVGQDALEELSFAAKGSKGLNFGWPAFEGKTATSQTCRPRNGNLQSGTTHTASIFDADRRVRTGPYGDWISVIGGSAYRGKAIPGLRGTVIFGDYKGRRMVALQQCGDKTSPTVDILKNADPNQPNAAGFSRASGQPAFGDLTAIVEDNDGEIYFVANRDRLLKVVPRK